MSTSKSAFSVSITDCGPLLNAALIFCVPSPGTFTCRSRGNDTA